MPEQLLDRAQVGTAFEQVGCVGVAEPVGIVHEAAQDRGVERPPADGEEQRVVRAARKRGPRVAEIGRDGMRGPFPERDDALLAALAEHVHRLLLEVHVGEPEPDHLGGAEAAGIRQLEDRRVAHGQRAVALDRGEDRLDLGELRSIG